MRLLTVLVSVLLVPVTASAPSSAAASSVARSPAGTPVRIMAVGDSITHGSTGDFTWRFFLWKHLVASGVSADMVGPKQAPYGVEPWPGAYADEDFDQDHAATWGDVMTPGGGHHDPTALLSGYRPDVVVVALGTNDLAWLGASPAELLDLARTWVATARATSPGTDFVIMEVPYTTRTAAGDQQAGCAHDPAPVPCRATAYNALLPGLAAELGTASSRVVVASVTGDYVMGADDDAPADTYDLVHPTTRGQVKLAAGVADALSELGVGDAYPRPLQVPAAGLVAPPLVSASGTDAGVRLDLTFPVGATGMDVWSSVDGDSWNRVVRNLPRLGTSTTASTSIYGAPCSTVAVRTVSRKGWQAADLSRASAVSSARVGPPVSGAPQVQVHEFPQSTDLSWEVVPNACEYVVRSTTRHPDGTTSHDVRVTGSTSYSVPAPPVGAESLISVAAVGGPGPGPSSGVHIRVTAPPPTSVPSGPPPVAAPEAPPSRVSGLEAVVRGRRVMVRWAGQERATRYEVRWRPVGGRGWRRLEVPGRRARISLARNLRTGAVAVRVRAVSEVGKGAWSRTIKVRLGATRT